MKSFDPNNCPEFDSFFKGCVKIHDDYMKMAFPDWHSKGLNYDVFTFKNNKKYVKVIRGNGVHCFVDKTNGDVLKAAGWYSPAKHARGNIFDEHNGLGSMGEYGPAYLRQK